jgi:SPP1 family predicted phage head-tail adaptor
MTVPRAGDLHHRVAIERQVLSPDGAGGASAAWEIAGYAWVDIRTGGGDERLDVDAETRRVSHEIWLRYREDVSAANRIRFGARLFDIEAVVDPDQRRRWLRMLCQEIVT